MGQSAMVLVPVRMEDIKPLQEAIRNLHGCGSRWLRSEPIHETFRGATVWQGQVEVFQLYGHTEARRCYAWSYVTDEKTGRQKFHAVLGVTPVNSAVDAVRAVIAADWQD